MLFQIEKEEVVSANIIWFHVPVISPQLLPAMLLLVQFPAFHAIIVKILHYNEY